MSKGMLQRIGIAQALVADPRWCSWTSPPRALDPVGPADVRDLLRRLRARGMAVFLNSHLLSEVEMVCDRVAILVRGEVVEGGTPAELARPRGVEIETAAGTQAARRCGPGGRAADRGRAGRAGRRVYGVRVGDADARGGLPRGGRGGRRERRRVVAGYAFCEAVRRKVFAVVLVLTVVFLVLFGLANHYVFATPRTSSPPQDVRVDTRTLRRAGLVGLAMFATLFLGVVLAVFLTLGVVSGDTERGFAPAARRPADGP